MEQLKLLAEEVKDVSNAVVFVPESGELYPPGEAALI
jgi:hypothetical protein